MSARMSPRVSAIERGQVERRTTRRVDVGGVIVGGGAPIVVQSMTNTDTADIDGDGDPGHGARPGRVGARPRDVNTSEAAAAVPEIRERLDAHRLQRAADRRLPFQRAQAADANIPDCARALAKYRINPGNVGKGSKRDSAVRDHDREGDRAREAGAHRRQLGQPRPDLLARMMDDNAARRRRATPTPSCARRDRRFRARERGARRGARAARRPHRPVLQGQRRAGPDRRVPRARAALRLSAAPRA